MRASRSSGSPRPSRPAPRTRPTAPAICRAWSRDGRAPAQLGLAHELGVGVAESWTEAHAWCLKSAGQFDRLGLFCLGRHYRLAIGVAHDRKQAVRFFERAEDQGDGQSKFFARWRRVKENCVGYRNERERERFLFVCAEPVGRAFASSHQRNMWLSEERHKMERDLRLFDDGFGKGACEAAGGSDLRSDAAGPPRPEPLVSSV